MSKLAQKLRVLRAKSGLKNKEIAEYLDKSEQTVSGYMSLEKSFNPDFDTLKKISQLFSVSMQYLIDDDYEIDGSVTEQNSKVNEKPNPYGLRKDQLELLEMLDDADPKTQDMIWSIIHTIIDARKQNK